MAEAKAGAGEFVSAGSGPCEAEYACCVPTAPHPRWARPGKMGGSVGATKLRERSACVEPAIISDARSRYWACAADWFMMIGPKGGLSQVL